MPHGSKHDNSNSKKASRERGYNPLSGRVPDDIDLFRNLMVQEVAGLTDAMDDVRHSLSRVTALLEQASKSSLFNREENYDIIEDIVPLLKRQTALHDYEIVDGVAAQAKEHKIPVEDIARSLGYHSQDRFPRGTGTPPLVCVTRESSGNYVKTDRKPAREILKNGLPGNIYMLREDFERQNAESAAG